MKITINEDDKPRIRVELVSYFKQFAPDELWTTEESEKQIAMMIPLIVEEVFKEGY